MTLGLCIICKGDDLDEVSRLLSSVDGVFDEIYITWTKLKPKISVLEAFPQVEWSKLPQTDEYFTRDGDLLFDHARNFNLQQATTDYIAWFDSDDVVIGAESIKQLVTVMERKGIDAVYADYHYEIDPETKQVLVNHPRERIVKRGVFEWKGHLHETLIPNRQVKTEYIQDFYVEHHPSSESRVVNMERNIRVLSRSYQKERQEVLDGKRKEIDPRTEYYLGRCYFDTHTHRGYERASYLFQDYLEHSGWDEERAQAWNYLGNIYFLSENYKDAEKCFLSAIQERPEFPTWHINLARTYVALREFKKAEFHITTALRTPQPQTAMIVTPRDDEINTLLTLYMIYLEKKDLKKTIKIAQKLYTLHPTEDNKHRLESIQTLYKWDGWLKVVREMAGVLKGDNETPKILSLINSLPREIANSQTVSTIRATLLPPKTHENSVVIYCGQGFEPWSPKNLETGIGGSEEAVIYLARELAQLGKSITVYGYPATEEGTYDGVEYLNYYRFNPKDTFDTLIVWRNPYMLKTKFHANKVLLDLHDVPEASIYQEKLYVDTIMVKSEYHKSLLPKSVHKKVKVIPNGIDGKLLLSIEGNNTPYKVFYGSSYDRGLHGLLSIWKEVKQAIPEAELHICYGWNLYDDLYKNNPAMMAWKEKMVALMDQEGIVHHGRVGKRELYSIAKSCGVWAYPATFEEIDCITGRYTQALGLYPVVYNYAALETTVISGLKLNHDPHNPQSIDFYKKELIKVLRHPESTSGKGFIDAFDWSVIAKRWLDVIQA